MLRSNQVAIIINDLDPASIVVGRYYAARRGIDKIIHVKLSPTAGRIKYEVYAPFAVQVKAALEGHPEIKAIALAFRYPYRIECSSITTALAMGMQRTNSCSKDCYADPTLTGTQMMNPYYDSVASSPPSIATRPDGTGRLVYVIAARTLTQSIDLIDRGIASDATHPLGIAYIPDRKDPLTKIRAYAYQSAHYPMKIGGEVTVAFDGAKALTGKKNVLTYFQTEDGLKYTLAACPSNEVLPGAVADNLDSFGMGRDAGGNCEDYLKWYTGACGAVSEPYATPGKFMAPYQFLHSYSLGNTLVEAMWASIWVPLNSLVVCEGLANPYGPKGGDFPADAPPTNVNYVLSACPVRISEISTLPPGTVIDWKIFASDGRLIKSSTTKISSTSKLGISQKVDIPVEGIAYMDMKARTGEWSSRRQLGYVVLT